MKIIKTTIIAVALGLAFSASAEGLPPTTTFEVSIYSVRLPVSESGTVSIRECEDCDYHSLRVTPGTIYSLNNESMSLERFRKAITDLRQDGDVTVNVRRDDTYNVVVNIRVAKQ